MKRQDLSLIIATSVFAAILALAISTFLFSAQQKKVQVPQIEQISSQFPDVNNDPSYKAIFNSNALDPTQTITIGQGQNGQPFAGSQ